MPVIVSPHLAHDAWQNVEFAAHAASLNALIVERAEVRLRWNDAGSRDARRLAEAGYALLGPARTTVRLTQGHVEASLEAINETYAVLALSGPARGRRC